MLGFLQDLMLGLDVVLQFNKEVWDRLAPLVTWSLWKARCVWMFQDQIVPVEETIPIVWLVDCRMI